MRFSISFLFCTMCRTESAFLRRAPGLWSGPGACVPAGLLLCATHTHHHHQQHISLSPFVVVAIIDTGACIIENICISLACATTGPLQSHCAPSALTRVARTQLVFMSAVNTPASSDRTHTHSQSHAHHTIFYSTDIISCAVAAPRAVRWWPRDCAPHDDGIWRVVLETVHIIAVWDIGSGWMFAIGLIWKVYTNCVCVCAAAYIRILNLDSEKNKILMDT